MDSMSNADVPGWANRSVFVVLALLFAATGTGLTAWRTYKNIAPMTREYSFEKMGMVDFKNGGYLPALAFRNGVNPYSEEICERYPKDRPTPPYSPVVFVIHLPFTAMSFDVACVVYFVLNVALYGVLAYWSLTMSRSRFFWAGWLTIFGLIVFSRPGHISLYNGYFTPILALGTLAAVHFGKSNPVISGVGLLLTSCKPTFVIPLVILMVCRKNYRAVATGLALSAVFGAAGLMWLASFSSLGEVIAGVRQGQAAHLADEFEIPANTWTRIDLTGATAKVMEWDPGNGVYFGVMLVLLVVPCIAVWRIADDESNSGATGLSAMIVLLAMLVTIYHHAYDGLLLVVPWVGVTFFGSRVCGELSRGQRWALTFLLGVPAINYVATLRVREMLGVGNQDIVWHGVTSINPVCLMLALGVLVYVAFQQRVIVDG